MLQTYSRFRITVLSHQRNVADTQFCNQASLCRMVVLKSSALTVSKRPGGKAILPSKDSKAFKRRTHSKLSGEGSCSAHPSVTVNRTEEREKVFPIKFQNDPCAWVQKEVAIWSPVHSHFTCNQGEISFPKLQVNVQLIVPDMLYTHTHTHTHMCACAHTHTLTHMCTHTKKLNKLERHTHAHIHTHTYTHTCAHTQRNWINWKGAHTHTHTLTHTCAHTQKETE